MLNILGESSGAEGRQAAEALMFRALQTEGASVHWYGKEPQPGRKLGHITIVAPDNATARQRLNHIDPRAAATMEGVSQTPLQTALPSSGVYCHAVSGSETMPLHFHTHLRAPGIVRAHYLNHILLQ